MFPTVVNSSQYDLNKMTDGTLMAGIYPKARTSKQTRNPAPGTYLISHLDAREQCDSVEITGKNYCFVFPRSAEQRTGRKR